jgi:hypothetical protein
MSSRDANVFLPNGRMMLCTTSPSGHTVVCQ